MFSGKLVHFIFWYFVSTVHLIAFSEVSSVDMKQSLIIWSYILILQIIQNLVIGAIDNDRKYSQKWNTGYTNQCIPHHIPDTIMQVYTYSV